MNTNPARGMRDFLPDDVRRRQYVIGVIADVYQRYGYEPLETPSVENIETLLGKYGEEGDRLIFRILKRGDEAKTGEADLALRYDLTVPLARVIAEYRAQLPKFFKRYQIQPVWRADRPQKGRFREFYQCDVDAIGSTSPVIDAESDRRGQRRAYVSSASTISAFVINHRGAARSVCSRPACRTELHGDALVALDKLDKIGADGVRRGAARERGADANAARPWLAGSTQLAGRSVAWFPSGIASDLVKDDRICGDVRRLSTTSFEISRLVARHERADRISSASRLWRAGCRTTLARSSRSQVNDLAGSLGGGGRYDNLVGMFLGQQVPAAGFSLGLERILVVMTERGMFPPSLAARPADVMVTIWNADTTADAIRLAGELRAAGLRTDIYPEADKIGKQFKYADSRGIPLVTVVGDDEAANGQVAVKNLKSGEQTTVAAASAVAHHMPLMPNP